MEIHVSHYPPGTSQWNPIEHKVFSPISIHWRGKPLDSFNTVVQYIAHTTNATGLKIKAVWDERKYDIGRKVSKAALAKLNNLREMCGVHIRHGIMAQVAVAAKGPPQRFGTTTKRRPTVNLTTSRQA